MRRLVLLTHQFPRAIGDAPFVEAELSALAAEFDDVVVFSFDGRPLTPLRDLPPGVRFGGDLHRDGVSLFRRTFTALTLTRRTMRVLRNERAAGRPLPFVVTARAVLAATRVAADPRLRAELVATPADSVTLYLFWGMGSSLAAPWLDRPSGGLVLRLHRYDLLDVPGAPLPFRASMFRCADRVLLVADEARRRLAADSWVAEGGAELHVAHLGTPDFGTAPVPEVGDVPIVFSCSSVTPVKRVPLIAEAVSILARDRPLIWVHAGDGPELAAVRHALKGAPEQLQVELLGSITRDAVIDFYRTRPIAAFINASSSEGLPVSLMEAVSAGVPCVATDVGGAEELVGSRHGTGILVQSSASASELANALGTLISQPTDRMSVRRRWAEQFDQAVTGPRAAALVRHASEARS